VWPCYGPVSAAKAALESHIRQLAFELAPMGVTANAIRAGVTDTPALRRIPGGPELHQRAMERNPSGRATTPEDVAIGIAVLANDTDADGNLVAASVTVTAGPANGAVSVNSSGVAIYTPRRDFTGTDTFTYRASYGTADGNPALVTITVNPVNDAPVATPATITLADSGEAPVALAGTDVETAVVHYGDTTLTFMNNWYRADQRGNPYAYTSAAAVEEKSVIDYNTGNPDGVLQQGEQPRPPRVPLVAIYPEEGHGVRSFPASIDLWTRAVAWFERFMPPGPQG
jgi:VCBS repeat-containing protein